MQEVLNHLDEIVLVVGVCCFFWSLIFAGADAFSTKASLFDQILAFILIIPPAIVVYLSILYGVFRGLCSLLNLFLNFEASIITSACIVVILIAIGIGYIIRSSKKRNLATR